jgi:hypothetical protein
MSSRYEKSPTICILTIPESSGAVIYGLYEVLSVFGDAWAQITGDDDYPVYFDVKIVAQSRASFTCVSGVPVTPHAAIAEVDHADVVIITDITIDAETDHREKWLGISPCSITNWQQPIGHMSIIFGNFSLR